MLAAEHQVVRRICSSLREPNVANAVSSWMKPIGAVIVTAALSQFANGAGAAVVKPIPEAKADAGGQSPPAGSDSSANLIAFVGRRIEGRSVEHKPKPRELLFDAEYLLRYEVLEVVFGTYTKREIDFSSYIHTGPPAFKTYEYGLIYVSKRAGRFVQQKYLFQPVYPTANGRWAGCGDPYDGGHWSGSGVKAEPIKVNPPVVFDIRNVPQFVRERKYPLPLFRYDEDTAVCLMGNYPDALFRVMKEGILTTSGVFPRC